MIISQCCLIYDHQSSLTITQLERVNIEYGITKSVKAKRVELINLNLLSPFCDLMLFDYVYVDDHVHDHDHDYFIINNKYN